MTAIRNLTLIAGLALSATACSKPEEILTGLREGLRSPDYNVNDPKAVEAATERAAAMRAPFENKTAPANLGPLTNVAAWTHRGANATHTLPDATLSTAPQLAWVAKIGNGNELRARISAEPVSDGSTIYTMDSAGQVFATSTAGATLWSADLTAPGERSGHPPSGGGLALGGGKLFATTDAGELIALDPGDGHVIWRQKFLAAVSGAPTFSGGQVFVTTAASEGYAVRADNGRLAWRLAGVTTQVGVQGVAAPAMSGRNAIFPLANGSLLAVDVGDGSVKWVARLPGDRPGAALSVEQGFTGEPVVTGGMVYAATPAGKAIAVTAQNGAVRWTADEGAQGMMAVAGGSIYMVSDEGKLVRLNARDGSMVWSVDLPHYVKWDKPRKLKSIYPAFGPVLAAGRLWVASGDGGLRAFDPTSGATLSEVQLPAGAAARPITVGGALYVVTEKGQLAALR